MNHRKSKRYCQQYSVADTQRERPPIELPLTVDDFLRALFWALDENVAAVRGGTRWGTR